MISNNSNITHFALRFIAALVLVGIAAGDKQDDSLGLPPAEESFSRDQVRSWSPYKVREVVGQLAETVEDLGKKLLEMPIEGPSGAPGPPGPRGLPVSSMHHNPIRIPRPCNLLIVCEIIRTGESRTDG